MHHVFYECWYRKVKKTKKNKCAKGGIQAFACNNATDRLALPVTTTKAAYGKEAQQAANTLAATKLGFCPSFDEEKASAADGKKTHGHRRQLTRAEEQNVGTAAADSASRASMAAGVKRFLSSLRGSMNNETEVDGNFASLLKTRR